MSLDPRMVAQVTDMFSPETWQAKAMAAVVLLTIAVVIGFALFLTRKK
jgi:hypothetical protein